MPIARETGNHTLQSGSARFQELPVHDDLTGSSILLNGSGAASEVPGEFLEGHGLAPLFKVNRAG
jgi:hypothetical protein